MGSNDFIQTSTGADVQTAFNEAWDVAAWEYGHGGYTGTIAEKHSYVVIQSTPLTENDADNLADQLMTRDDDRITDKWGPAGAIPVVLNTREETVTIPEYAYCGWDFEATNEVLREEALAALRKKRLLRRGEKVQTVNVTSYQLGPGQTRTNVQATVALRKSKSQVTPEAVAAQPPEAWLFFGSASC